MQNTRYKIQDTKKGFTLIELLVVIAIIGILGGIVFVGMEGHVERARITRSISFSHSIERTIGHYLVGRWSFDKGTGTTTYDRSPFGNHGTIHGATFSGDTPHDLIGHGHGRYSLSFDGVGDYVDAGNDASLDTVFGSTTLTLEAWVYPKDWVNWCGIIQKKYHAAHLYQPAGLFSDGGGFRFVVSDGTVSDVLMYKPSLNAWYHIVATLDGSNLYLYANGVQVGTTPLRATPVTNTDNLWIAGFFGQEFFKGLIDEVRIYNRALSAYEIQYRYVQGLESLLAREMITEK